MHILAIAFGGDSHPFAQVGTRPAKEWIATLERPDRVAGLKTAEVIEKLELKKGDVVADLGAGTGVFAWPLARAVAPGAVYAVEVDDEFVAHLKQRVKEQGLTNVTVARGKFEDPLLPGKIDLAFFSDVLHHIANGDAYLKTVAGYLKPGGRIAVIELDVTIADLRIASSRTCRSRRRSSTVDDCRGPEEGERALALRRQVVRHLPQALTRCA